tara:strand:+ start:471 stop:1223 length:753 start_codon:yes stop_codon:yes gene_type:complete
MKDKVKPPIIYKFVNFKTGVLDILINGNIKFSRPSSFNDPFDCYEELLEYKLTREDIIKFAKERNFVITEDQINDVFLKNKDSKNEINELFLEILKGQKDNTWVSCFSKEYDEILMWSHYAEKHKGICIGFSTYNIENRNLLHVDYVNDFEKKVVESNSFDVKPYDYWLKTKYIKWSYEDEVRVISSNGNEFLQFQKNMVKEVYFGSEVEYSDIIKTVNNLKKLGYSYTIFYRMLKGNNNFSLSREKIIF